MLKEPTQSNPIPASIPMPVGYLGPAKILEVDGRRVHLECPDAYPWATMALAHTYRPAVGDTVLTISQGNEWFVIGVIAGSGTTEFTAPGDLLFQAPKGRISFVARESISIQSRFVEVVADALELSATSLSERFTEAARWVAGVFHLRARRMATKVDEEYDVEAKEITERAEGDVTIDGKMIHLA